MGGGGTGWMFVRASQIREAAHQRLLAAAKDPVITDALSSQLVLTREIKDNYRGLQVRGAGGGGEVSQ